MSDSEKLEFFSKLKFYVNGLIPAIIQDASTLEVLTVAFMNRDTIELSLAKRETPATLRPSLGQVSHEKPHEHRVFRRQQPSAILLLAPAH